MKKVTFYLILIRLILNSSSFAQTFQWARHNEGRGDDLAFSVAVDASGNVYTTGFFSDTIDLDPGVGVYNLIATGISAYVSKLDASGNFVWAKSIGGSGTTMGQTIKVDGSANVYIGGSFQSTTDFDPGPTVSNLTSFGASKDIFICKLTTNGIFVWAKQFGGTYNFEEATSLALDNSGNIYFTGQFGGTADFDPGPSTFNLTSAGVDDIFVAKLSPLGTLMWAKRTGGSSYDGSKGLSLDNSNNVLITGFFQSTADFDPGAGVFNLASNGSGDIFILKLNSLGNFVWAKQIGGSNQDISYGIAVDNSGSVFTTGTFGYSGGGTVDFDPGAGVYNFTTANADMYINKLDNSGNFLWAKQFNEVWGVNPFSMVSNSSGDIYVTGNFSHTIDFDPDAGMFNLSTTSSTNLDIFVLKMSNSGNFIWAGAFDGGEGSGYAISVDASDNVYTAGYFMTGTMDFDPGFSTYVLSCNFFRDNFVQKMNGITGINENEMNTFSMFPNPATTQTHLIFKQEQKNAVVSITDMLGKVVKTMNFSGRQLNLDIEGLAKGVYLIQTSDENKIISGKKMMIQ